MALIGASLLIESDGPGFICSHESPEKTVGICLNGNIFPSCGESVSDQIQGALGPNELTCTL